MGRGEAGWRWVGLVDFLLLKDLPLPRRRVVFDRTPYPVPRLRQPFRMTAMVSLLFLLGCCFCVLVVVVVVGAGARVLPVSVRPLGAVMAF